MATIAVAMANLDGRRRMALLQVFPEPKSGCRIAPADDIRLTVGRGYRVVRAVQRFAVRQPAISLDFRDRGLSGTIEQLSA
jgi:hypothetical protein